jgi:hypothetical protein
LRAKADLLALHVGQRLDAGIGLGDENRLELGVFLALGQRHDLAARADVGLHVGKATEPDQIHLLVDQRFHRRRVVADRRELDLHAQRLFQIGGQRRELAHLFGGSFFGDGGHPEHGRGLGVGQTAEEQGGNRQNGEKGMTALGHGIAFRGMERTYYNRNAALLRARVMRTNACKEMPLSPTHAGSTPPAACPRGANRRV